MVLADPTISYESLLVFLTTKSFLVERPPQKTLLKGTLLGDHPGLHFPVPTKFLVNPEKQQGSTQKAGSMWGLLLIFQNPLAHWEFWCVTLGHGQSRRSLGIQPRT
jgi:hypothetical protein